jgi:hypothetical protein
VPTPVFAGADKTAEKATISGRESNGKEKDEEEEEDDD